MTANNSRLKIFKLCAISVNSLLIIISLLLFSIPVKITTKQPAQYRPRQNTDLKNIFTNAKPDQTGLFKALKPGLFQPIVVINNRPAANNTIERIKSQLKLQCIMDIKGEKIAYINIDGIGMKKCKVGQNINSLFKVIDIQPTKVELSIIEHKVTLSI